MRRYHFTTTKPFGFVWCGSMVGALFGSPLAVGLYWGYPGWKKMGSGTGYHLGIVILYAIVGLTGLSAIITAFIPEAVVLPILVFVGISSYSQAFEVVKKKYYPAVIMALCRWLWTSWWIISPKESFRASWLLIQAPRLSACW